MLKIDFYESGKGETTIITFPDESIGVVDAFPSACGTRPDIVSLAAGKKLRFICLSHPHDDHARDLSVLIEQEHPEEFWNTVVQASCFFYWTSEAKKYKSTVSSAAERHQKKAVESVIDLFSIVKEQKITQLKISSETKSQSIAGVDVFFFSPDRKTISDYEYGMADMEQNKRRLLPNPNLLSSVIAFRYGKSVFIHGGDTEAEQWNVACREFKESGLPLSVLMKIPHHGAANALHRSERSSTTFHNTYIKLFQQQANLVVFGNATHPNKEVWRSLRNKTENIYFLLNQFRPSLVQLPLNIPHGRLKNAGDGILCNSHIHAELDDAGIVTMNNGLSCRNCDQFSQCLTL